MVRITRVYTGTGDDGTSSFVDGSRHDKSHLRFEVVGTCDELNATLGIILMECDRLQDHGDGGQSSSIKRVKRVVNLALSRIQNELFDLGAELACLPSELPEYMELISEVQSELLLNEMDAWQEHLQPLRNFILPSGQGPEAIIHLSRTVTRRLERSMVRLMDSEGEESVRKLALVYVNRLSDWLFVLGRWVSFSLGNEETIWKPLANREQAEGVVELIKKFNSNDNDFSMID
ncbi:MAG: cob(I)yrinic acid a,c-diamide adenosyltransferase [Candidatus Poseidoniaceae archaeon]|nr:cob(I)yrinic acid a,c-diamide adenosyltransferase [Candidatus Poseidoniaceae archaeon]